MCVPGDGRRYVAGYHLAVVGAEISYLPAVGPRRRRLLMLATVLGLLAVLVSGPMAFSIAMTPQDPNELTNAGSPLLAALVAVVCSLIAVLLGGWACRRRFPRASNWSAATAITLSALILATLVYAIA